MHKFLKRFRKVFKRHKLISVLVVSIFISGIVLGVVFRKNIGHVVYVYRISTEARKISKACSASDVLCYAKAFGQLAKIEKFSEVIDTLHEVQKIDKKPRDCHLIAHFIAEAETKKYPKDLKRVISEIDPNACYGGFLHETLDTYMRYSPEFKFNARNIDSICSYIYSTKGKSAELYCYHGIGHMVLLRKNGNIPEAVRMCAQMNSPYPCYDGLFMESVYRENLSLYANVPKIPFDKKHINEQVILCKGFDGEVRRACWRELVVMFIPFEKGNLGKIYNDCNKTEILSDSQECYLYGVNILLGLSVFPQDKYLQVCQDYDFDENLRLRCVKMEMSSLLQTSKDFIATSLQLCASFTRENAKECYKFLGIKLQRFPNSSSLKKEACSQVPSEFEDACLFSQAQINDNNEPYMWRAE